MGSTLLSRTHKKTGKDVHQELKNEGIICEYRTIQRDLKKLAEFGWIDHDAKQSFGWKVIIPPATMMPGQDITTSIMFVLAGIHLRPLLPPSLYKQIEPFVTSAKQFLSLNKRIEADWEEKVAVIPKGYIFNNGGIADGIIETVYESLFKNKKIDIEYTPIRSNSPQNYTLSPHGLVVREDRTYLLASAEDQSVIKQYLLHRISKARMQTIPSSLNEGFSLSDYIKNDNVNVKRNDEKLDISLSVSPFIERFLRETPLSDSQIIESNDEDFTVTATVNDVEELRHWLLSVCHQVTIIEPLSLRKEIEDKLKRALSNYIEKNV